MDSVLHQIAKRPIDQSLSIDTGGVDKGVAFDDDGKMRFARSVIAHMACMMTAVVNDLQMRGRKGGGKAIRDFAGDGSGGDVVHPAYIGRF